jgi:glycine cleavage system H protein
MKEISELLLPEDVKYTDDHEWARVEDGRVRIGISDYAQEQLGDVVFIELPEVGRSFTKGEEFGTVESVKAVSELYMPISGKVIQVNTQLEDSPELVNREPYKGGWMVLLEPGDLSELTTLKDKTDYLTMLKG